ncbi:MAG: hypothetical protein Q4G70_16070 [Pseudomonadota bacterium]|nr:hypothetical protein [Pseudomonadota bacterium]
MAYGSRPRNQEPSPGLVDRLLCAVLGPVFVNVSILLTLAVFKKNYFGDWWFSNFFSIWAWSNLPTHKAPLVLTVLVPAVLGFLLGSKHFATLIGHMFYTNHPNERSEWITGAIWAGFALYVWVVKDGFL